MMQAPHVPGRRRAGRAAVECLEGRVLLSSGQSPGFVNETVTADPQLVQPTSMAFAPDGRLFVTLQRGSLRVLHNVAGPGPVTDTEFMKLTVDGAFSETGLLSVEFDPDFASNRYLYVYYTVPAAGGVPAFNRVSRFTASAANPDVVEPGSEQVLLNMGGRTIGIHNGGAMHFGPDGKLYVAVGNHAASTSQSLATLHGKILRINSDGSIPEDNPFYNVATGDNRAIWALGLRNPYTFAFQPGTGRMYINDVGENRWEEVDEGRAGANYGWPNTQDGPFDATDLERPDIPGRNDFAAPLYYYRTGAITGGVFYNPAPGAPRQYPADYVGDYFFGDFKTTGLVRRLDPEANPGINLSRFNLIRASVTYDGANLTVTLRDLELGGTFTQSYPVDIPALIGDTAYAGFIGGTNGFKQEILNWAYTPGGSATPAIDFSGGFNSLDGLSLTGEAAQGVRQIATLPKTLRLNNIMTDATPRDGTAFFTTAVPTAAFSTEFVFKQVANTGATGQFTFTLRGASPSNTAPGQSVSVTVAAPNGLVGTSAGFTGASYVGSPPERRNIDLTPTDGRVREFDSVPFAVDFDVGPDGMVYSLAFADGMSFAHGRVGRFRFVPGPRVTGVTLDRTAWDLGFRSELGYRGIGTSLGYTVPGGAGASAGIPWAGIDRVRITFDRPMDVGTLRQAGALTASDAATSFATTFLDYDPATRTATWAVTDSGGRGVSNGLRLVLSDAVKDDRGDQLNGEWATGQSYPSGDGAAGGALRLDLALRGGDANRDGRTDVRDLADVRSRIGHDWRDESGRGNGYTPFADIDGDRAVTFADVAIVRAALASGVSARRAVALARFAPASRGPARRTAFGAAPAAALSTVRGAARELLEPPSTVMM